MKSKGQKGWVVGVRENPGKAKPTSFINNDDVFPPSSHLFESLLIKILINQHAGFLHDKEGF